MNAICSQQTCRETHRSGEAELLQPRESKAAKRKKLEQAKGPGLWLGLQLTKESRLLLAENRQKANHRLNALVEVRNMELLIGSVDVVVGQSEAHHHRRYFQIVAELFDDGDRAAGADIHRFFVKHLVQRLVCGS